MSEPTPAEPERVETEIFPPPRAPIGCVILWMLLAASVGLGALVLSLRPIEPPIEGGTMLLYSVADPARVLDVARMLDRRLMAVGVSASAEPGGSTVRVLLDGQHADSDVAHLARRTIERSGELWFRLVVTEASSGLYPAEIDAEAARIAKAKAAPEFDPARERWDVAPDKDGKLVLVERDGVSGTLIAKAYRTQDYLGQPAVGFDFGPEGRKRFFDLTSNNVNRALAIILDGKVLSAPVIRGAIGERGIIEGGHGGFTEGEVRSIVAALETGQLPARVELVSQTEVFLRARPRPYAIGVGALAAVLAVTGAIAPARGRRAIRVIQVVLVVLLVALLARHLPLWQMLGQK
jgi:preprotein translocase subunit SecD